MKTIQKISALLAVSASLSMAGVIDIYTDDGKKPSTSLNLTTIDSLTFSGKAAKKELDFSGKAKQKAIKLADIDRVEFSIKKKSKETMTVEVAEGVSVGKHTYKLAEIKKIEIVETDSDKDKDGDGLTDIEEVYKYDTNPNSTDTDGDGWSDSEELADGMYSPSNPTKFNPRIADVPGLRVTLKKSPSITLNITTSEGKTESESVSKGSEVSKTNSTSYEESRSTDIMHAWEVSTTQGVEVGAGITGVSASYSGSVTLGYNGSYTTSTGMTWNSTEENSVAESYEKAVTKEKSEGNEVSGATVCMQVELKNTSDIAFTIEALKLSASIYDIKDAATLKILAELSREGDWSDITLKPAESVQANFCNNDVKVELIEDLIYNTSSIILGSSTQKITIDGGGNDFTVTYTKVVAKTADITIDYGPEATGNQSERYQVATNYRYNPDNKGSDDMYAETSLAELLRNAHVDFEQDSVKGPSKKKLYGLSSIEGYKYNLKDSAMWYVTIQRASDIKKGRNTMELYTVAYASYDLDEIFVGAGDAVHIFYSKDQDHDGVPLLTEHLFGSSDKKVDSDGDGLSDYEEINGWTKGKSKTKIYTNPANKDTDGDGINDKEDPKPTENTELIRRLTFEDATLSMLQVFADSSIVDSSALLNLDSATLADADSFNVLVQAPSAFIKVVPNAEKVAWVKVTTGKIKQFVTPTVEDGKDVYIFETPGELTVLKPTIVKIEVRSGDEATVKTYTLSISSTLIPPTNLKLGKSADRSKIIVNFDHSTDTRVKGYVILRYGVMFDYDYSPSLPDNIENKEKIVDNGTYKGFESFVTDSSNSYTDSVGAGSLYYTYRVYAYAKEGSDMVFSTGTEPHRRSVGRLLVRMRILDWGTEYFLCDQGTGVRSACRINATVKFKHRYGDEKYFLIGQWDLGNSFVYNYRDDASKDIPNGVIFFSQAIADGHASASNKPKSDYDDRTYSFGREGLDLEFNIKWFKVSESSYLDSIEKHINWEYEKMMSGYGNGRDGDAPKQGENRFLIGRGGIKYDDTDGICDDSCGDEPHTGYSFWITYVREDDDDFY